MGKQKNYLRKSFFTKKCSAPIGAKKILQKKIPLTILVSQVIKKEGGRRSGVRIGAGATRTPVSISI